MKARLFTFGAPAVDENGVQYFSEEGCAQGDPLGPFLWSVGYHHALLEQQAKHPGTLILAYLDDTYHIDEPLAALAALRDAGRITEELSQALNLSTALDPRAAADLSSEAAATAA